MDMTTLFNDTSWRDRLAEGKGTFRGVPFWMIEDTTLTGGRRIVRHEYPLRDDGETEDMGCALRQYAFTAVVFGDTYFDQRDTLIDALEAEGVAELVHPTWGTLNIQIETYTVRESCGALGTAMFSITFSPAADNTAPIEAEDAQLNSDSLADSLLSDVQTGWASATAVIISLFTDRRALDSDELPTGPNTDKRGWWGDTFQSHPMGSRLWLLSREKQRVAVLKRAKNYADEALAWLVDDRHIKQADVTATAPRSGFLLLAVTLTLPNGSTVPLSFNTTLNGM